MKYDESVCKFNMDTGCVELLLRDGRMISIDCTGVEDELDVTMAQRSELDYLIYCCISLSEKSSKLVARYNTDEICLRKMSFTVSNFFCLGCCPVSVLQVHNIVASTSIFE